MTVIVRKVIIAQWESTPYKVTSTHSGLQNWAGGTLKSIKLIRMNSRFAKVHKKGTGTKMAEKLNNFEKFERKEIQLCAQLSNVLITGHML